MRVALRHARKSSTIFLISNLPSHKSKMVDYFLKLRKVGYDDVKFNADNLYAAMRVRVWGEWIERQMQIKEVLEILKS